jgi:DNA processing protein
LREFAAALKLSREKGVGAATFCALINKYVLPSLAWRYWQKRLRSGQVTSAVSSAKSPTTEKIEQTLQMIREKQLLGWYFSQPGYPEQLKDLGEPPPVLFASSPVRSMKYAAVVGARALAPEAPELVKAVCSKLFSQGYAIVSGGAAGIDAVAHRAALDAGVYTLAVLGTGLDIVYPRSNRDLFADIACAGALMTELMPGTRPARSFFPTRNRIIAAMADIVVVVQAATKSGSAITADWARRLKRPLFTVAPPSSAADSLQWAGNQMLIETGAAIFDL